MDPTDDSQYQLTPCDKLVDSVKAGAIGLAEVVLSSVVDYIVGPPSRESRSEYEDKSCFRQAYEGLCDFFEGRTDYNDDF